MLELELVIISWMDYLIVFRQMLRSSSVNQLNNVVAYLTRSSLSYLKLSALMNSNLLPIQEIIAQEYSGLKHGV